MKFYPGFLRLHSIIMIGLLFVQTTKQSLGHLSENHTPSRAGSTVLVSAILDHYPYLVSREQREWLESQMKLAEQSLNGDIPEAALEKLLLSIPGMAVVDFQNPDSSGVNEFLEFDLPGDRGGILFKVTHGPGPTTYKVAGLDLALSEVTMTVPVAPTGTTWVLLGLNHVPDGKTVWYVSFDPQSVFPRTVPLRLNAPQTGRLSVDILSDDTGRPTPAIVQLKWLFDGSVRAPGSVVDYTLQFDSQARSRELILGSRLLNLPGIESGHFWVCSGPFDMALPPGEWQITILRGLEHLPVVDTFSVTSGDLTRKTYRPKRWVGMSDLGWYSGDDHVHMQIQSDADADRLMTWAKAEDIHLLNVLEMGDHERTFFQQRSFGQSGRVQSGDKILVPGQEDPRISHLGHTIALNIAKPVRDTSKYYLHDWVYDRVHEAGGLYGYAHVNRGLFFIERDLSLNLPKGKVDFVEILQFHHLGTDLYYRFLNLGEQVTASAGSDVPWGRAVGEVRVYAYLGKKSFSADAWFEALENGRTFVTNGPMLQFSVDEALPGDLIHLDPDQKTLRIKARAWGHPDRILPTRLEVVRQGEVIKSAKASADSTGELHLEFDIDPGPGCWLAARAYAKNGSVAHTTPIYLKRSGLRFWKHEEVPVLIEKNLESLKELEDLAENISGPERMEAREQTGSLVGAWYAREDRVRAKEMDYYDSTEKVWGNDRPKQSLWSARWHGWLTVPADAPGCDALYLKSSGAASLTLDGRVVINNPGKGEVKAAVTLQPGKAYAVILDYQHLETPLAYLHLLMSKGDGDSIPVPASWMSFTKDDFRSAYRNGLGSPEEQRTLAAQAPELLKRIEEARKIYRQLLDEWELEKPGRRAGVK